MKDEEVMANFTDAEYEALAEMFDGLGWKIFTEKILTVPVQDNLKRLGVPCDDTVLRAINGMCMHERDLLDYIASLIDDIENWKEERTQANEKKVS